MSNLQRVQVYIDKEQMRKLKIAAKKGCDSVSELIRKAIARFLKAKESSIDWDGDPIARAVGRIELEVTDASVNHDKYLYGREE